MDKIDKIGFEMTNISNFINDFGMENLEIEMFVKGDAVKAFMKNNSEFAPLIQDLAEKKVEFNVCAIAMSELKIEEKDLLDFVIVDSL